MNSLEPYIRAAALERGIDPDVAVRVAMSEGGLNDPTRQSEAKKNGVREPSYGPFQLLVGGGNTGFPVGLGNEFIRQTGMDPRNPEHAQAAINFALDTAKQKGWGQWYGAKRVGLDNFAGIGGRPSGAASSAPIMGQMTANTGQQEQQTPQAMSSDVPSFVQQLATPQTGNQTNNIFGMLAAMPQQQQAQPAQILGPSPEQANALSSLVAALKAGGYHQ